MYPFQSPIRVGTGRIRINLQLQKHTGSQSPSNPDGTLNEILKTTTMKVWRPSHVYNVYNTFSYHFKLSTSALLVVVVVVALISSTLTSLMDNKLWTSKDGVRQSRELQLTYVPFPQRLNDFLSILICVCSFREPGIRATEVVIVNSFDILPALVDQEDAWGSSPLQMNFPDGGCFY